MAKKKTGIKNNINPNVATSIKNTKVPEAYLDYPIVFSFELLDRNEYFDFSKTCDKWAVILLEAFKELSSRPYKEALYNPGKNLSFHSDAKAFECPIKPPHNIKREDMTQIRFSRSNGRVHGCFNKNIFRVVWLDPLHNVFPDDRYGGIKKVRMLEESCCDSLLKEIQEKDNRIKKLEYLEELLDKETR